MGFNSGFKGLKLSKRLSISLTKAAVDRHLLPKYPAIKIPFVTEISIKQNNLHEQLHHITPPHR
jgi:hypothetical protein